jgi:N-glycosylase/DNA lyase
MRCKIGSTLENMAVSITGMITEILSRKSIEQSEHFYWKELVACIIGSRTRAEIAHAAMATLINDGHLRLPYAEISMRNYQNRILKALTATLAYKKDGRLSFFHYPFPHQKSKYITECARNIYRTGTLTELVNSHNDCRTLRRTVCMRCIGIGPKQASLFIRNTGISRKVAVLDTHILEYMRILRLLHADERPPTTIASYEKKEQAFSRYATMLGYDIWVLDMAVWFVMRVYKKDKNLWAQ